MDVTVHVQLLNRVFKDKILWSYWWCNCESNTLGFLYTTPFITSAIKPSNLWYVVIVLSCTDDHHCVVPENIHASPTERISSKTSPPIWKFQLRFRHFFKFLVLQIPSPHPLRKFQSLQWGGYGYFLGGTFLQSLNNWLKHFFYSKSYTQDY